MKVSDLTIGIRGATLEQVATAIHERLGYSFAPRTSSYLGGDYFASVGGREEVLVHLNRDGEEIAEVACPECSVLLQVNGCEEVTPWRALLQELDSVLIRENHYEA